MNEKRNGFIRNIKNKELEHYISQSHLLVLVIMKFLKEVKKNQNPKCSNLCYTIYISEKRMKKIQNIC